MAYGGGPKVSNPVLLGFVDEFMETNKAHYTTNKVGGSPDWCNSSQDPAVPLCGECGSELLLVTQIYAPLSGSLYHRTLYIFGCIQTICWNKPSSWACLRSQVSNKTEAKVEPYKETVVAMAATDWLGDADDWGDDNDDNGNFSCISPDTSSPSPVGAVGGFPTNNFNLNDKQINAIDSEDTLDITMNNLNIKGGRTGSNLNDTNANVSSPARGASAPSSKTVVTGLIATAEIEMDDEDSNVAIDSPEVGNTNIPHLFATANREVSSKGLKIDPFYIWVQEESLTPKMSEHEMSLLMEYKAKEALDHVVDSGSKSGKTAGGGDTYEKTIPSHGDEFFHKFITVIQNNPGQILRYGRDSQSSPLLLRPLQDEKHICSHCGAESVFELQLLPSLVAQLSVAGLEGAPMEFGTVLVMACQKSCWSDTSNQPRFEKVLVQAELM